MEKYVRISTVSVRQLPFDFRGNRKRIVEGLKAALHDGPNIVLFPELSLTGYGCEDNFSYPEFMESTEESFKSLLFTIIPMLKNAAQELHYSTIVSVGLPLQFPGGQVFNVNALISDQGLIGFVCKQFLAKNGLHYEPRWFSAWEKGSVLTHPSFKVPMGDIVFDCDGVRIGYEICEDSWISNRPGRSLYQRNVDIILNPSASHFATGKYQTRENFVKEGSRAFGVVYAYSNLLGCENGTAIFDGGNLIASKGRIISRGDRHFMGDFSVNTVDASLHENLTSRIDSSEKIFNYQDGSVACKVSLGIPLSAVRKGNSCDSTFCELSGEDLVFNELSYAIANGLWDWFLRTNTNGFSLSLSGGADSALAAVSVSWMCTLASIQLGDEVFSEKMQSRFGDGAEKEPMKHLLTCVYQKTDQSSDLTESAAKTLANSLGAQWHSWDIQPLVDQYVNLGNQVFGDDPLSWEKDDIALQNIQARTRSPGIWLIANRKNQLLIATSNLSEAALGYATMDGDTSGVIAPLSGLPKTTIRALLKWMESTGIYHHGVNVRYQGLQPINVQAPTAELRPGEQNDEDDLMPYVICDFIMRSYLDDKLWPSSILHRLRQEDFAKGYTPRQLGGFIERWFTLFCRNPWKRFGCRAGFHLESISLDPKSFHRFPLLNSGFKEALYALNHQIYLLENP